MMNAPAETAGASACMTHTLAPGAGVYVYTD